MTCQKCGRMIPDGALACMFCLEKQMLRDALEAQRNYVLAAAGGRLDLYVVRKHRGASGGHIALFGHRHAAYCGELLPDDYYHRKERAALSEHLRPTLCGRCCAVFDAIVKAARATEEQSPVR